MSEHLTTRILKRGTWTYWKRKPDGEVWDYEEAKVPVYIIDWWQSHGNETAVVELLEPVKLQHEPERPAGAIMQIEVRDWNKKVTLVVDQ